MTLYTFRIGAGSDGVMQEIEHAEMLEARGLVGAISNAEAVIAQGTWHSDTNLVQLLLTGGSWTVVAWVRAIERPERERSL